MAYDWTDKCVLVTGGTGFIGSFFVEYLLDHGAKVRVPVRSKNYRDLSMRRDEIEWVEGDLRDAQYCLDLVRGVDYIFHLASHRRNTSFHEDKCGDVATGNVQMTVALLEALREQPVIPSVTFFSTANIPPSFDAIALAQRERVNGYMLGKALSESLWFAAATQREFPLLIVRPVGTYGPRDTFAKKGSNIIPSFMMNARDKQRIEIHGEGKQRLAFLYVEDLLNAVMAMIDNNVTGIQYVVPPDIVTTSLLAKKIRQYVRPDAQLVFHPDKTEGERTLPRLPMHECIRSVRWTSLDDGIRQTLEWWQSNRDKIA